MSESNEEHKERNATAVVEAGKGANLSVPFSSGALYGDQTSVVSTSILPCVALEYGQILCAASTSSCATSRSTPGTLTLRRARRKKEPPSRFRSISASIAKPAGRVIFLWEA
jgi:hypothetical protein